jgi:hypothetical protein
VLVVPDWHPATVNQLLAGVRQRIRLKKADLEMVGTNAHLAGVPKATGKRRVSLRITLAPCQRGADPDAFWKSTLDSLVHAGLLVDDSREWVQLGTVTFDRGPGRSTVISLKDLPAGDRRRSPRRSRFITPKDLAVGSE